MFLSNHSHRFVCLARAPFDCLLISSTQTHHSKSNPQNPPRILKIPPVSNMAPSNSRSGMGRKLKICRPKAQPASPAPAPDAGGSPSSSTSATVNVSRYAVYSPLYLLTFSSLRQSRHLLKMDQPTGSSDDPTSQ